MKTLRALVVSLLCLSFGCADGGEEKPIAKLQGIGQKKTVKFTAPDNWVVKWKADSLIYFHVVNVKTEKRKLTAGSGRGLPREGSKFFEEGGEFVISVNASGPWTFTIHKHKFDD